MGWGACRQQRPNPFSSKEWASLAHVPPARQRPKAARSLGRFTSPVRILEFSKQPSGCQAADRYNTLKSEPVGSIQVPNGPSILEFAWALPGLPWGYLGLL